MPSFIVVKGRKDEYSSTSQRFTLSFNVCRSRQMDVLYQGGSLMPKSVQIAPETGSDEGQIITFVLAIGSVRQVCRLETTFRTQHQAFSYLHKHRTAVETRAPATRA